MSIRHNEHGELAQQPHGRSLRQRWGSLGVVLAFALTCTVLASGTYGLLSGTSFDDTESYSATFLDISGLSAGDEVSVAGVGVGTVQEVHIEDGKSVATFGVDRSLPMDTSVKAVVRYQDLTGGRYLALIKDPKLAATPLPVGARLPVSRTAGALDLDALYGGFQPLLQALSPTQVNQIARDLTRVLQGEGSTVVALLADIAAFTAEIADRDKVIGQVITNLNTVLAVLIRRDQEFVDAVDAAQELVSGLARQRRQLLKGLSSTAELTGQTADALELLRPELTGSLTQAQRVAALLTTDRNQALIDKRLKQLPEAYLRMYGAGSYGAFFNFYLCGVGLKLDDIVKGGSFNIPPFQLPDTRCEDAQ